MSSLTDSAPAVAALPCCPPELHAEHQWAGIEAGHVITADATGGVHACYRASDGTYRIRSSEDDGTSFGPENDGPFEGARQATCAAVGNGGLMVAYLRAGTVWTRWSDDAGRSFGRPVPAFPMTLGGIPLTQQWSLELLLEESGVAALKAVTTEVDDPSVVYGMKVAMSSDFGTNWARADYRNLAEFQPAPSLALLDGVAVHAWIDRGDLSTSRSTDGGMSWEAPIAVTTGETVERLWLASTSSARFQLLYDTDAGRRMATASEDAGASWSRIRDDVGPAGEGAVAGLAGGEVISVGPVLLGPPDAVASNSSTEHGLLGTWAAMGETFSPMGLSQHDFAIAGLADGSVLVAHDDYRHDNPTDCPQPPPLECESIYLARSCEAARRWLPESLRVDDDEAPNGVHSETPKLVTTPRRYAHVFWSDQPDDDGTALTYKAFYIPPIPKPDLLLETVPGEGCDGPWRAARAVPDPLVPCDSPTYQWFLDGVEIPGAGGDDLVLPEGLPMGLHEIELLVDCDSLGCGGFAGPIEFEVGDPGTVAPPEIEALPPEACASTPHRLSVPGPTWDACGNPHVRWFRDGVYQPDLLGPMVIVSQVNTPPGSHEFTYELLCDEPFGCSTSPSVMVFIADDMHPLPAPVGNALRADGHSDPHGAEITGHYLWPGDEGAPRAAGEHYHWRRSEDPRSLAFVIDHEPLTDTELDDVTEAATDLPHVWFYKVFAADDCEYESVD